MRTSRKSAAFLAPGMLLFFGMTLLLFRLPGQYPLVGLLYYSFTLSTAVLVTVEMAAVFAVFVTLAEIICVGLVPSAEKMWIAGQIPIVWISLFAVQKFQQREEQNERACVNGLRDRQQGMLMLQKERESLEKRLTELDVQMSLRQNLNQAVHQLASLLDPVLVRQRLMEFVRSAIDRGTIHYFAGNAPRDLMDKWVMERKLPLLVTDVAQDSRFKPARSGNEVRSVLAAPILVEKQPVGILRLNGFEPDLFSVSDLRVLEALTLLASLALENLQLLSRLEESATRDNLTGLFTHRFFQERLAEEILRAGRYHHDFCLLLMDIDHFKRYNDTYGHAAGDQVLVRFSQVLQQHARPVDWIARYGGEEFVMVLPQTNLEEARRIAETIRQAVANQSFQFGPEVSMMERVTVSMGISNFPAEATIASQLIRVADYRLYQAKEAGRNRVIG